MARWLVITSTHSLFAHFGEVPAPRGQVVLCWLWSAHVWEALDDVGPPNPVVKMLVKGLGCPSSPRTACRSPWGGS